MDLTHEIAPPPLAIKKPIKKIVQKQIGGLPPVRRPISFRGSRPKIQDIKIAPKLIGPLEELRSLNLIDFRRLSPNPQEAAQKIKQKIENLASESFAKRMAGIKAWQASQLYRLYLIIGQQSIQRNKLVREIIDERQQRGEPILTLAEFESIMDLNKSLRF